MLKLREPFSQKVHLHIRQDLLQRLWDKYVPADSPDYGRIDLVYLKDGYGQAGRQPEQIQLLLQLIIQNKRMQINLMHYPALVKIGQTRMESRLRQIEHYYTMQLKSYDFAMFRTVKQYALLLEQASAGSERYRRWQSSRQAIERQREEYRQLSLFTEKLRGFLTEYSGNTMRTMEKELVYSLSETEYQAFAEAMIWQQKPKLVAYLEQCGQTQCSRLIRELEKDTKIRQALPSVISGQPVREELIAAVQGLGQEEFGLFYHQVMALEEVNLQTVQWERNKAEMLRSIDRLEPEASRQMWQQMEGMAGTFPVSGAEAGETETLRAMERELVYALSEPEYQTFAERVVWQEKPEFVAYLRACSSVQCRELARELEKDIRLSRALSSSVLPGQERERLVAAVQRMGQEDFRLFYRRAMEAGAASPQAVLWEKSRDEMLRSIDRLASESLQKVWAQIEAVSPVRAAQYVFSEKMLRLQKEYRQSRIQSVREEISKILEQNALDRVADIVDIGKLVQDVGGAAGLPQPVGRDADAAEKPAGTNAEGTEQPAGRSADGADKPAGRSTDGAEQPAGRSADGTDEPAGRSADRAGEPAGKNADSMRDMAVSGADGLAEPAGSRKEVLPLPWDGAYRVIRNLEQECRIRSRRIVQQQAQAFEFCREAYHQIVKEEDLLLGQAEQAAELVERTFRERCPELAAEEELHRLSEWSEAFLEFCTVGLSGEEEQKNIDRDVWSTSSDRRYKLELIRVIRQMNRYMEAQQVPGKRLALDWQGNPPRDERIEKALAYIRKLEEEPRKQFMKALSDMVLIWQEVRLTEQLSLVPSQKADGTVARQGGREQADPDIRYPVWTEPEEAVVQPARTEPEEAAVHENRYESPEDGDRLRNLIGQINDSADAQLIYTDSRLKLPQVQELLNYIRKLDEGQYGVFVEELAQITKLQILSHKGVEAVPVPEGDETYSPESRQRQADRDFYGKHTDGWEPAGTELSESANQSGRDASVGRAEDRRGGLLPDVTDSNLWEWGEALLFHPSSADVPHAPGFMGDIQQNVHSADFTGGVQQNVNAAGSASSMRQSGNSAGFTGEERQTVHSAGSADEAKQIELQTQAIRRQVEMAKNRNSLQRLIRQINHQTDLQLVYTDAQLGQPQIQALLNYIHRLDETQYGVLVKELIQITELQRRPDDVTGKSDAMAQSGRKEPAVYRPAEEEPQERGSLSADEQSGGAQGRQRPDVPYRRMWEWGEALLLHPEQITEVRHGRIQEQQELQEIRQQTEGTADRERLRHLIRQVSQREDMELVYTDAQLGQPQVQALLNDIRQMDEAQYGRLVRELAQIVRLGQTSEDEPKAAYYSVLSERIPSYERQQLSLLYKDIRQAEQKLFPQAGRKNQRHLTGREDSRAIPYLYEGIRTEYSRAPYEESEGESAALYGGAGKAYVHAVHYEEAERGYTQPRVYEDTEREYVRAAAYEGAEREYAHAAYGEAEREYAHAAVYEEAEREYMHAAAFEEAEREYAYAAAYGRSRQQSRYQPQELEYSVHSAQVSEEQLQSQELRMQQETAKIKSAQEQLDKKLKEVEQQLQRTQVVSKEKEDVRSFAEQVKRQMYEELHVERLRRGLI